MGSIFGFYQRDGGAAEIAKLGIMEEALRCRVSDRSWQWAGGRCALGVRLLHRARGAELERPPAADARYAIACDARLDNFEELVDRFGFSSDVRCDSELILELFKLLGEKCVDHLLGAFSFAVFDATKGGLFCARDHFGEKPFVYRLEESVFAFGSEARAVRPPGSTPISLSEERAADFVRLTSSDKTSTAFEGVHRLSPGHFLSLTPHGCRITEYWRPRVPQKAIAASDEEISAEFRKLLSSAVASRLGGGRAVGTTLSGGLDSSAVTVLARRELAASRPETPLHSFSAIFPDFPAADEQQWIDAVEAVEGSGLAPLIPHRVRADLINPLDSVPALIQCLDEPVLASNLYMTWELARQARDEGVTVLLTGHDGDTVVSHGLVLLTELVLAEDWESLELELERLAKFLGNYEQPRRALLNGYVLPAVGVVARSWNWPKLSRIAATLRRRFAISGRALVRASLPSWMGAVLHPRDGRASFGEVAPAFRTRGAFKRRVRMSRRNSPASTAEDHLRGLLSPLMTEAFEIFDRVGASWGVEFRHPFFDKRLVEFCLALPRDQKVRDGWTRFVMRNSMAGILPEVVRWRLDKSNIGDNFYTKICAAGPILESQIVRSSGELSKYWNIDALVAMAARVRENPAGRDAMVLHLVYTHSVWLESLKHAGRT